MIWLSSFAGSEQNCYFDIRDMDLRCQDGECSAQLTGVVGVGAAEVWADVVLGNEKRVKFLPVWHDNGEVESLPAGVDEEQLGQAIVGEVEALLSSIISGRSARVHQRQQPVKKDAQAVPLFLAA